MAQRGREAINKRARERARQERQEVKRQRREMRSEEPAPAPGPDEAGLLEEFRKLSERHASRLVSESHYQEERRRILAELGIETSEDE